MNTERIPDGVWPTMVTPYREDGSIDYAGIKHLVDWYVDRGVAGLFAVCQSSEMFFLSLRERLALARTCVEAAAGRVPVIASGHVAETLEDQVDEAVAMTDTGVDAVVLIANRFAAKSESDDRWRANLEHFLDRFPEGPRLGIYECPYPYKRTLSPALMRVCADSGRFDFLKDTCSSAGEIRAKLAAAEGTGLKLFNANAATLLDSLRSGAAGYSGVMANFHPELYVRICANWREDAGEAEALQDFLGMASMVEYQLYPVNAMYALSLQGVPFRLASRRANALAFSESMRLEVEQLVRSARRLADRLSGPARA